MRIVELAGIGPTPFAGMMLSDMGAEVIRVDRVGEIIAARTQDEWVEVFEGTDACVTPVLTMGQTPGHPHALARDSFFRFNGVVQPRPAPVSAARRPDRRPILGPRVLTPVGCWANWVTPLRK